MKLLWHIARRDLRRLRGWLALRTLVLIATAVTGWRVRDSAVINWNRLTDFVVGLAWVDGALVFVIALLLVQEDRLVGTNPFWITRPVSGGRLLAAKLLSAAIAFAGLSTIVLLPWWLICGFGMTDIAWAIAELGVLHLVIALPAAMLAALTDSFARALLWTLVLAMAAVSSVAMWGFFVAGKSMYPGTDLVAMRTLFSLIVLGLTLSAIVALQYFTRRTARSLFILGGGLLLAVVTLFKWPANWVPREQPVERNAALAADLALTFDAARAGISERGKPTWVTTWFQARGVPENMLLSANFDSHVWQWADGMKLEREGWTGTGYRYGDFSAVRTVLRLRPAIIDEETELRRDAEWQKGRDTIAELRKAQGLPPPPLRRQRPRVGKPEAIPLWGSAQIPMSLAQRLRAEPSHYTSHIWLTLTRPVVWAETPLKPGDWIGPDGHRFRVVRATTLRELTRDKENPGRDDDNVKLGIVTTEPATLREDWMQFSFLRDERLAYLNRDNLFCAINRQLGRLDELHFSFRSTRIGSVKISTGSVSVTVPKVSRDGKWVDWQPSWRDDATLVILGWHKDAVVQREVIVDNFQVKP